MVDLRSRSALSRRLSIILGVLLVGTLVASAQQFDTGTIVGSAADLTGALIGNATITVTNIGTGIKKSLESNAAGDFTVIFPAAQEGEPWGSADEHPEKLRGDFVISGGEAISTMMQMDWTRCRFLPDARVRESVKTLGQLQEIFANEEARREMDPNTVVYSVQAWCPVPEGTEGGLFWGSTIVEPGQVESEYFMTHGHFHLKRDRTEYYGTIEGEGALILMDEDRNTRMEPMSAGTLHFIPPHTAHRVANVGKTPLRFVACWPSDAGYDYEYIRKFGFSACLMNTNRGAVLVRAEK